MAIGRFGVGVRMTYMSRTCQNAHHAKYWLTMSLVGRRRPYSDALSSYSNLAASGRADLVGYVCPFDSSQSGNGLLDQSSSSALGHALLRHSPIVSITSGPEACSWARSRAIYGRPSPFPTSLSPEATAGGRRVDSRERVYAGKPSIYRCSGVRSVAPIGDAAFDVKRML